MKETGPGPGCWNELLLTLRFKGTPRSNLNDQISIYFNSLIATQDSVCGHSYFLFPQKQKPDPKKAAIKKVFLQTQEEAMFALKNQRFAFCFLEKGLTSGHQQLWKHRLRGCLEPISEPHSRLLTKCPSHIPRKTNMNGIKTPREGGFE